MGCKKCSQYVYFEIDLASLNAFLTFMEKNASDSLANEVGAINSTLHKTHKTQQIYFFMNFMMMRSLLNCIKKQAIISNSMMQSVVWLIKNRYVCFRISTTNLGLNVRKFVLSTQKMFAVSNKLALAETLNEHSFFCDRGFFRALTIFQSVV